MNNAFRTILIFILSISLTACASSKPLENTDIQHDSEANQPLEIISGNQEEINTPSSPSTTEEPTVAESNISEELPLDTASDDTNKLSAVQRNSFSMLYYLAIVAEQIRSSKDNRVILEDIYTSLLNDLNPSAIDETTQIHLQNLRSIINKFLNIKTKRERLQFIYNQNKASAIRNAIPNPIAVLSVANSLDWKRFASAAVFTVADSYRNYKNASSSADLEYLMSGWDLNDEEISQIQRSRDTAFDYMVDIVQEYQLDGLLTLSERDITGFSKICAIESIPERTHRLESEEKTYQLLGNYWLELANCYFESSKYDKCIEAVNKYESLSTGIYRLDHNYVQILPKAIVAASEVFKGDEYISVVSNYADSIIDNTKTDEWSTRYFAAEVYLDLYKRTGDSNYLKKAYDIAYDNVTILIQNQRELNKTYISDVVEVKTTEPDYRYMTDQEKKAAKKEYAAEKKRADAYNKALNSTRKTELPALYEPLILNCDLLFALAKELNIDDSEKKDIEAILQTHTTLTNSQKVFISNPINYRYSFSDAEKESIVLDKEKISIPVYLLTDSSTFSLTVEDSGKTTEFSDLVVSKVDRKNKSFDEFVAAVTSKSLKKYKWSTDSRITLTISYGDNINPVVASFRVSEYKDNKVLPDKVEFEQE